MSAVDVALISGTSLLMRLPNMVSPFEMNMPERTCDGQQDTEHGQS